MSMRSIGLIALIFLVVSSCNEPNDTGPLKPTPIAPVFYEFERNGESTVDFNGQTTRIQMAHELLAELSDPDGDREMALLMFRNEGEAGADVDPFTDPDLNASTKSIRSKVAASIDLFATNTVESEQIRADFESWITAQFEETLANKDSLAKPGVAGQIADGIDTRYVSAQGLEYDQVVNKALIGALMVDQMINNYLSTAVLDAGSNRADNDAGWVAEGKTYTVMEHKWDEAYGYLFGTSQSASDPLATLGQDDKFLNKYVGSVNEDEDFNTFAKEIFDAFKDGRTFISESGAISFYDERDLKIHTLRTRISEIIAIRAVHYLVEGANAIDQGNMGAAFHALSEAYGFIYSLRFTRQTDGRSTFQNHGEVEYQLNQMLGTSANGLWDARSETLHELADHIAEKFDFTKAQAAE